MSGDQVFVGTIVSSRSLKVLEISNGYLIVKDGKITKKGSLQEFEILETSGALKGYNITRLTDSQFIIPGFVDCHTHAPQFPNIGLGLDRPLLEWLDTYTFPLESQYSDTEFAAKVYDKVVQRLLKNGTTTACYFGSLHLEGTMELAKSVVKYGQRALVGKVSMNIENDVKYYNETKKELMDVEAFVVGVLGFENALVQPIITPRFALSCDLELMTGLSKIATKYGCRTQSHISENLKEIECALKIFPSCSSYAHIYDTCQIFNNKCIMAHAIHLTEEEIDMLSSRGVSIAHCPASNTRLKSGLCPVRKYLDRNITVGLGTDVSGGDSATILDALRRTMDVSTHLELQGADGYSISWMEAVYLATMGGAKALNMDDKIGNFDVGKDFDALLVDVFRDGAVDKYDYPRKDDVDQGTHLVQRFVYLGDDRNIARVYVNGRIVKNNM